MFSRFRITPICDRRTNGQTDRRTHGDSVYRASIASRGKKPFYNNQSALNCVVCLDRWKNARTCSYRDTGGSLCCNSSDHAIATQVLSRLAYMPATLPIVVRVKRWMGRRLLQSAPANLYTNITLLQMWLRGRLKRNVLTFLHRCGTNFVVKQLWRKDVGQLKSCATAVMILFACNSWLSRVNLKLYH